MNIHNWFPEVRQGEKLTKADVKIIQKQFDDVYKTVEQRKRGMSLMHNTLQSIIGIFFQLKGYAVVYEKSFSSGGFNAQKVRFDIVAEKGKKIIVVEVKDIIDKRDFGQVNFYTNILESNKIKAKVYLGLDLLSLSSFDEPAMNQQLIELMQRENAGVIFADKRLIIIFDNAAQWMLQEMPLFLYTDQDIT